MRKARASSTGHHPCSLKSNSPSEGPFGSPRPGEEGTPVSLSGLERLWAASLASACPRYHLQGFPQHFSSLSSLNSWTSSQSIPLQVPPLRLARLLCQGCRACGCLTSAPPVPAGTRCSLLSPLRGRSPSQTVTALENWPALALLGPAAPLSPKGALRV